MKVIFSYGHVNNDEKETQRINIRVRHGKVEKSLDFRRSTGLEINRDDWDFINRRIKDEKQLEKKVRTPEQRQYLLYLISVQHKLNNIENTFTYEFQQLKLSNKIRTINAASWNEWCDRTLKQSLGIPTSEDDQAPIFLDKFRRYIDDKRYKGNTLRNNESSFRMLSAFMDYNKFLEYCDKNEDKDHDKWLRWYTEKYGRSKSRQYRTDEIDMKFYHNLKEWNLERGNGLSGAFSDQIKHIKKVLEYYKSSEDIKVHHNVGLRDFKGYRSNPDHDILTESELDRFFNYSGKGYLENARDLAKVQYYACMRYDELRSELAKGVDKLKIYQTMDGYRWDILQGKTDERKGIPVHEDILEMIQNDTFPHIISDQKYREYIKEILQILEIDKTLKIGTHTFRRSFCTNMFNAHHSFQEIAQYSGHSTERQLREYIQAKNVNFANTIPTKKRG